eukprot:1159927-Pelagomonas_calceolata.AAC.2
MLSLGIAALLRMRACRQATARPDARSRLAARAYLHLASLHGGVWEGWRVCGLHKGMMYFDMALRACARACARACKPTGGSKPGLDRRPCAHSPQLACARGGVGGGARRIARGGGTVSSGRGERAAFPLGAVVPGVE